MLTDKETIMLTCFENDQFIGGSWDEHSCSTWTWSILDAYCDRVRPNYVKSVSAAARGVMGSLVAKGYVQVDFAGTDESCCFLTDVGIAALKELIAKRTRETAVLASTLIAQHSDAPSMGYEPTFMGPDPMLERRLNELAASVNLTRTALDEAIQDLYDEEHRMRENAQSEHYDARENFDE